jgi:hypothetical protein
MASLVPVVLFNYLTLFRPHFTNILYKGVMREKPASSFIGLTDHPISTKL